VTVRPAVHPRLILAALASCGVLVSVMQTIVVPLLPELPGLTHSKPADVSCSSHWFRWWSGRCFAQ
jgi:energy-converting hydrogenase Eha subunit A